MDTVAVVPGNTRGPYQYKDHLSMYRDSHYHDYKAEMEKRQHYYGSSR